MGFVQRNRVVDNLAELREHGTFVEPVARAVDKSRGAADVALVFDRVAHKRMHVVAVAPSSASINEPALKQIGD